MPSSNKTPYINLNDWTANDKPKREDFNNDNRILDSKIESLESQIRDMRESINNILYGTILSPFQISGNADLNNLVAPGEYYSEYSISSNAPVDITSYSLTVYKPKAYGNSIIQIYRSFNGFIYIRTQINNEFSAWNEIVSSPIPSSYAASESDRLNQSYGVIDRISKNGLDNYEKPLDG